MAANHFTRTFPVKMRSIFNSKQFNAKMLKHNVENQENHSTDGGNNGNL